MFSGLNVSLESRKRRGGAFACGVLCDALLLGAAFFLSKMPTKESPATTEHYAVTWLPDLTPPEKLILPPRRVLAPVLAPKLKPPEVSKLMAVPVADTAVPEAAHPPSTLPIARRAMAHPVDFQLNPPSIRQSSVRTGVFGGAGPPVSTRRPLEAVQTGGFWWWRQRNWKAKSESGWFHECSHRHTLRWGESSGGTGCGFPARGNPLQA